MRVNWFQLSLILVIAFCISNAAAQSKKPSARPTMKPSVKGINKNPSAKPTSKLTTKPTKKVCYTKHEFFQLEIMTRITYSIFIASQIISHRRDHHLLPHRSHHQCQHHNQHRNHLPSLAHNRQHSPLVSQQQHQ